MKVEDIAMVAHEANLAYCAAIGDGSQQPWNEAPKWQCDSAINGMRFHLDHPDAEPSASHENWMREKVADGWKYGPSKDPDRKEHPCIVPYERLPQEQRAKDALFIAVVSALKPALCQDGTDGDPVVYGLGRPGGDALRR